MIQILGFPRTDTEIAEEISRAIGHATFQSKSESQSGSSSDSRLVAGGGQLQIGQSVQEVRERVVTPDEIMTLGPDRQYVITSAKDIPRDALALHHSRYWDRPDARDLADPNPFVLRKQRATVDGALRLPDLARAPATEGMAAGGVIAPGAAGTGSGPGSDAPASRQGATADDTTTAEREGASNGRRSVASH